MKKVKFLLACLLLLPFLNNAQDCDVKSYCNNVEYMNKKDYKYEGCLNTEEKMHGYGKKTYSNGNIYCGNWKNGDKHGKGTFTFKNKLTEAEATVEYYFDGVFKEDIAKGNGILTAIYKYDKPVKEGYYRLIKQTKKGVFKGLNGFYEGVLINEYDNGLQEIENWQYAEAVSKTDNQTNYYDPLDIVGDDEKITVSLDARNNEKTYYIQMKFEGVSADDCVFDTGAESFIIGKRLFEKLTFSGVEVDDLLMNQKLKGISKKAVNGKYVRFKEVSIGDYTLKNVVAIVNLESNYTLIGMDFFIKFSNVQWDMKNKTLDLYR